jgi:hypothetical protein
MLVSLPPPNDETSDGTVPPVVLLDGGGLGPGTASNGGTEVLVW